MIEEIEGLECFINLQRFGLLGNQVTRIEAFNNVTNLTYVNLQLNQTSRAMPS